MPRTREEGRGALARSARACPAHARPARAGVVGLQGFARGHLACLRSIGVEAVEVRRPEDLDGLTHLVLPGGESTTLHHLLELFGLREILVARHREGALSLFGTCAGAILLGRDGGTPPPRLGLLDVSVDRNAYGRQVDSFVCSLAAPDLGPEPIRGVFIRAPKLRDPGPGVRVLARESGNPVLVESPGLLAATFHPELVGETRIHAYFLDRHRVGAAPAVG